MFIKGLAPGMMKQTWFSSPMRVWSSLCVTSFLFFMLLRILLVRATIFLAWRKMAKRHVFMNQSRNIMVSFIPHSASIFRIEACSWRGRGSRSTLGGQNTRKRAITTAWPARCTILQFQGASRTTPDSSSMYPPVPPKMEGMSLTSDSMALPNSIPAGRRDIWGAGWHRGAEAWPPDPSVHSGECRWPSQLPSLRWCKTWRGRVTIQRGGGKERLMRGCRMCVTDCLTSCQGTS